MRIHIIRLYILYYLYCAASLYTLAYLKISKVKPKPEDVKTVPSIRMLRREDMSRSPVLWYLCDEISRILRAPRVHQIKLYHLNTSCVLPDRTLALGIGICHTWGADRLTAVIAHEIGHLKQRLALHIMSLLFPYTGHPKGMQAYSRLSIVSEQIADHYAIKVSGPQAVHEAITYWILYEIARKRHFFDIQRYASIHQWFEACMRKHGEQIWQRHRELIRNEVPNNTHLTVVERQALLVKYPRHIKPLTPLLVSDDVLRYELSTLEQQIRNRQK